MKKPILVLVFMATIFSCHSQAMKIIGNITDATGPLPGAFIVLKGTEKGAQSDFDGNFFIDVEKAIRLFFPIWALKQKL